MAFLTACGTPTPDNVDVNRHDENPMMAGQSVVDAGHFHEDAGQDLDDAGLSGDDAGVAVMNDGGPSSQDAGADCPDCGPCELHPCSGGFNCYLEEAAKYGRVCSIGVETLAAGDDHTCALTVEGDVFCWGNNIDAQLGRNDAMRVDEPHEMGAGLRAVPFPDVDVEQLAAGRGATCALGTDGSLHCWGYGLGETLDPSYFADPAGYFIDAHIPRVIDLGFTMTTAVAVGNGYACALDENGAAKCWGANEYGQLGQGHVERISVGGPDAEAALSTIDLGGDAMIVDVDVGVAHSCALLATGQIKCWGRNQFGQLGLGHSENIGDEAGEMGSSLDAVDLGEMMAVQVSVGSKHTCALLNDDSVRCWGAPQYGRLGFIADNPVGDEEGEMGAALDAVELGPHKVVGIASSGAHSCAFFETGAMRCWGDNYYGQSTPAGTTTQNNNEDVVSQADITLGQGLIVVDYAVGSEHVCAVLDDASVKCFGRGAMGRLGSGREDNIGDDDTELGDSIPRVRIGSPFEFPVDPPGVKSIAIGHHTSCAVMDDERVICWGENEQGQLGLGHTERIGDDPDETGGALQPTPLGGLSTLQLAAGARHVCHLSNEGEVRCWGHNDKGQLGLGHTENYGDDPAETPSLLAPIDLGTGGVATKIGVRGDLTCALLDEGNLKCWGPGGNGNHGQEHGEALGDDPGELGDALPPISFGIGLSVVDVAVGGGHTCVLLDDGGVKCFGTNTNGELGLGDVVSRGWQPDDMGDNLPYVDLGAGKQVLQLVAGFGFSCALFGDGVKCWGAGQQGVLGQGNTESLGDEAGEMGEALPFVPLGDFTPVRLIAGSYSVCALDAAGAAKCWGRNAFGELGIGANQSPIGSWQVESDFFPQMGDGLPVLDSGEFALVEVVPSFNGACGVRDDGRLLCWGRRPGLLGQRFSPTAKLGDEWHESDLSQFVVDVGAASAD